MRSDKDALGFVHLLRRHGLRVTVGQSLDMHRALSLIDMADRQTLYFTLARAAPLAPCR